MSKKITDELLYKYCKTVDEYITDKIPNDEEIDHTYSEEFENKIKKIIKQENKHHFVAKFYKYSKKVAIIFLIIISVLGATMSVDAIRYRVLEFIKNVRREEMNYSFKGKIKSENFKIRKPSYIPKGFKEVNCDEISDFYFTLDYSDGYDYISFECTKLNNGNFQIDTEDSVVNKIIINGNTEADYIKKKDRHMLVWQDDENYYILFIDDIETSRMEDKYNELIKIAESVR